MAPILVLFVFWLALHGRLKQYADFAATGPGWSGVFSGNVNTGAQNPVLKPGHVSPAPGAGPLDWFWRLWGLSPPAPATPTAPQPKTN